MYASNKESSNKVAAGSNENMNSSNNKRVMSIVTFVSGGELRPGTSSAYNG
jgi:hypothetical protein